MNILDILKTSSEKVAFSESKNHDQLKNINNEYIEAFSEDAEDDFDNANSFDDFVDDGSTGGMDDSSFDSGGFDDGGFDDYSEEQEPGNLPIDAMQFLDDIDESDKYLVEKLVTSYSTLYNDQKDVYDKLVMENLSTTERGEEFERIKDNYRRALFILRNYIINKFPNESTRLRTEELISFNEIFTKLNTAINDLLADINGRADYE